MEVDLPAGALRLRNRPLPGLARGRCGRLQSQRVAIVFEQNVGAYTKPIVQVFYSLKSQMPIPVQRLDLSSPRCQDRIVSREPTENWASLDVDGLLKAGLSITAV